MNLRAFYNLETIKPRDYQQEAINFLMVHKYVILADEMGLGKSLEAFYACLRSGGTTLIVCPAFLVNNWKNEVDKLLNLPLPVLHWKSSKDYASFTPMHKIVITSYHGLNSIGLIMNKVSNVIIDEAHSFKNLSAKRTQKLHQIVRKFRPKTLILLTGTPAPNYVNEMFSLLLLCSYNRRMREEDKITNLYPTYWSFVSNFCYISKNRFGGINILGTRNELEFKKYLEPCYLRRTADEVLDLPRLIHKEILIDDIDDKKLLDAYEEYQSHKIDKKITVAKVSNAVFKTQFSKGYIIDLCREGQVLVFTEHLKSGEILATKLRQSGISTAFICGTVLVEKRNEIIDDFKNNKIQVLISTIKVGSVGYNLVNCRNVVFNDYSFIPSDNLQAIKRCHRMGQNKSVIVHTIFGTNTDKQIHRIVHKKTNLLNAVLGD